MSGLLYALQGLLSLGSLACFIIVIVNYFQKGEQKLGIICLVLLLACGIGVLVTFITGWMNATKLNLQKIMLVWTGCFLGGIFLAAIRFAMFGQ